MYPYVILLVVTSYVYGDTIEVTLSSRSVGCEDPCHNCKSYTQLNNETFKQIQPGLQILLINNNTGQVNRTGTFRFLDNSKQERLKLEFFLNEIPFGSLVVITLNHKCASFVSRWFQLLREYGTGLNLREMSTTSYESGIIITCQGDCPRGTYSEKLPLYRFEEARFGPLYVKMNVTLEIANATEEQELQEKSTASNENGFLIIILGSLSALCLIILVTIIVCCVLKYCNDKARVQDNRLDLNASNAVPQRIISRQQVHGKSDYNNGESSSVRKEFDNKAFKSDVLRPTNDQFTVFQNLNVPSRGITNHRNSGSSQTELITSSDTDGAKKCNTQRESMIYLEPVDGNQSIACSHLELFDDPPTESSLLQEVMDTIKIKIDSAPDNEDKCKEFTSPSNSVLVKRFPSTSSQLFTSKGQYNTRDSAAFAEYVKVDDCIIYKKPSNVLKHEPPVHNPVEKEYAVIDPGTECAASVANKEQHDYELPSNQVIYAETIEQPYKEIGDIHVPEQYQELVHK